MLPNRKRILLVDDDPLILKVLSDAFTESYSVVTAASGEEAVKILEGGRSFDLIVTDLIMGAMSGYDLAGYVKSRNLQSRYTPVIMLTSAVTSKEVARQFGCAAYVPKSELNKVVSMTKILLAGHS